MLESRQNIASLSERPPQAFLLSEGSPPLNDRNLATLLDFFGVPWTYAAAEEISTGRRNFVSSSSECTKKCILSSAPHFAAAIREVQQCGGKLPGWIQQVDSVFLYGFQESPGCQNLLRFLTQDLTGRVCPLHEVRAVVSITTDFPDLCGPLSGIQLLASLVEGDRFFDLGKLSQHIQAILTIDEGVLFFAVVCSGVRFYLSASSNIVDLQRPVTKYFDVKEFACSAIPAALYIKSACHDSCWQGAETSACLTVDDPLLRSRYGFLHFPEALELMDKQNFATTIGFIPWNWRRTDPSTVRMFRQRSDRVSISVHGCDHTAAEFATRSETQLNTRVKTARQRMERLREHDSLAYDEVMIFPQGAFSPESGHVLKLNGFTAAINTEVAPANEAGNETRIADVWDLAIMKYGTFPIFTRRYLTHGIENFAFDQFLGKPCFIVAHHDAFRDHAHDLVEFIAGLNSLNSNLHWRSLGTAIYRTFRVINHNGMRFIQIYATSAVIENLSDASRNAIILKMESDPDAVKAVLVNQRPVEHFSDGKTLGFSVSLPANQRTSIRVLYFDRLEMKSNSLGVGYSAKTRLRRYLSEFRDNYLSHSDLLTRVANRSTHRPRPPQNPI
jgi:hypothetical protein